MLDTFGRHRILTFDREPATREPTVEIAHEALLGAWARLRGWIDEARDDLRQDRAWPRAATEWRGSGQRPELPVAGRPAGAGRGVGRATDLAIGRPERAYLKASIDERDDERAPRRSAGAARSRSSAGRARRLRALVAVFAVAALVAGSLTLIATGQGRRAEREAPISAARELAAASIANLDDDPELAVLLAVEAVERPRGGRGSVLPEAEEALHRAIAASRVAMTVPNAGGAVAWGSAGTFAAVAADPRARSPSATTTPARSFERSTRMTASSPM